MTEQKSKMPSATTLLRDAWKIYKLRSKVFIAIVALPFLTYIPIFLLPELGLDIKSGIFFVLSILMLAIMVVMQLWSQPALLCAIWGTGENINFRESYKMGWHKLHSFIWIDFLMALVILFGGIFLIVPAVLFSVWFNSAVFVLIAENQKGSNALIKSYEYVKGHWFAVLWRLIFIIAVWMLLFALFLLIGLALYKTNFKPFGNIFVMLPSILFLPLIRTYYFLLYEHLKELKGEFHFIPPKGFSWLRVLIFSPIVLLALLLLIIPIILLSRLS